MMRIIPIYDGEPTLHGPPIDRQAGAIHVRPPGVLAAPIDADPAPRPPPPVRGWPRARVRPVAP